MCVNSAGRDPTTVTMWIMIQASRALARRRRRVATSLSKLAPGHEIDIVVGEQTTARLTGEEIEVPLAPLGTPVRLITGDGPHLGVVVAEVDGEQRYAWAD